jgi:endonuclease/exonuclease/phosphatase family metal-dependent hydrolase
MSNETTLAIAGWNIASANCDEKWMRLKNWLTSKAVAVAGLFEVKVNELSLRRLRQQLEPQYEAMYLKHPSGKATSNGMLIVKHRELSKDLVMCCNDERDRRWCVVRLELPNNAPPVHIAFIHGAHEKQFEMWSQLVAKIEPLQCRRLLLIGDFNAMADEEDAISTSAKPCFAFKQAMGALKLTDAWKTMNPEKITHASFVRAVRQQNLPDRLDRSRIDHAFVNATLLNETDECAYDDFNFEVSRDHCPIFIRLRTATVNIPMSVANTPKATYSKIRTELLSDKKEKFQDAFERICSDEEPPENGITIDERMESLQNNLIAAAVEVVNMRTIDPNRTSIRTPKCVLQLTVVLNRLENARNALPHFSKTCIQPSAFQKLNLNPPPHRFSIPTWIEMTHDNVRCWLRKIILKTPLLTYLPRCPVEERAMLKYHVIENTYTDLLNRSRQHQWDFQQVWIAKNKQIALSILLENLQNAIIAHHIWQRQAHENGAVWTDLTKKTMRNDIQNCWKQLLLTKEVSSLETNLDSTQVQNFVQTLHTHIAQLRKAIIAKLTEFKWDRLREIMKEKNETFKVHQLKSLFRNANEKKLRTGGGVTEVKITAADGNTLLSSDPEVVKRVTREKWSEIFQSVPLPDDGNQRPWFEIQAVRDVASRISGVSASLTAIPSCAEIRATLDRMKPKTSTDPSGISIGMYKYAGEQCVQQLQRIFHHVLMTHELPQCWQTSHIYLIPKPNQTARARGDVTKMRPIALLNQAYKILASLINSRLQKLIEEQHLFSDGQNGFRVGRTTHDNILTLLAAVERAGIEKKPIHIQYADLHKAYDTTRIRRLLLTLRKFGFCEDFVQLIATFNNNCKARVITAYGLTELFDILSGLRQGCGLSPNLFNIFLEPLIKYLEQLSPKPLVLGLADDLAWIAESNSLSQRSMRIASAFFGDNRMQLSIDPSDPSTKTTYTHNEVDEHGTPRQPYRILYTKADGSQVTVPELPFNQAYKYLGVYIALTKSWDKQYVVMREQAKSQGRWLKNRFFSLLQLSTLVKSITMPAYEYRLRVANLTPQQLNQCVAQMTAVLHRKMGLHRSEYLLTHDAPHHVQVPPELFGFDMPTLKMWAKALKVLNLLDGFNSLNSNTRAAAAYLWTKPSEYRISVNEVLRELDLTIVNGSDIVSDPLLLRTWYPAGTHEFFNTLERFGVSRISDLFGVSFGEHCKKPSEIKLRRKETLKTALERRNLEQQWNEMRKVFTGPPRATRMKSHIRDTLTDFSSSWTWDEIAPGVEELNDISIVWTDGSMKKNEHGSTTAGSGVFVHDGLKLARRTPGDQSCFNAELFAVLLALLKWPRGRSVHIIADNTAVLTTIQTAHQWTRKDWKNFEYAPVLRAILRIMAARNSTEGVVTRWSHVYSHVNENNGSHLNRQKLQTLHDRYGSDVYKIMRGNAKADQLAKDGTDLPTSYNFWQWLEVPGYVLMMTDGSNDVIQAPRKYLKAQCKRLLLEEYKRTKRPSCVPFELEAKVDFAAAKRFFTAREASYSPLEAFCNKVQSGRLKVHSPPDWKDEQPSEDADRTCPFAGITCPVGQRETIEHFYTCKGTKELWSKISPRILEIINRRRGCKAKPHMDKDPFFVWRRFSLGADTDPLHGRLRDYIAHFPIFWNSTPPSDNEIQRATNQNTLTLLQDKNSYFARRHVPKSLTDALLAVGVKEKYVRDTVHEIQSAIIWTYWQSWKTRCQFMWEQLRKKRADENDRIEEERERLHREQLRQAAFERTVQLIRRPAPYFIPQLRVRERDRVDPTKLNRLLPLRIRNRYRFEDPIANERWQQIVRQLKAPAPRNIPRWDGSVQTLAPDLQTRIVLPLSFRQVH